MPFWRVSTAVPGPTSGRSSGSASAFEYIFTATMTNSTVPIRTGLASALGNTTKSPSALRTLIPRARMASRLRPRATNDTS